MKAILISVRPQWAELILNRIKKDEIRKGTAIGKAINKLIKEQCVAPMLMYCTKDKNYPLVIGSDGLGTEVYCNGKHYPPFIVSDILNGKVLARFNATAEEIKWELPNKLIFPKDMLENACLSGEELYKYLGEKGGYDIHINGLEIFDKPKEISEFFKVGYGECAKPQGSLREQIIENYNNALKYQLTRAPQSWCYIEI